MIFKKNKPKTEEPLSDKEISIFLEIANKLFYKYPYLKRQINNDFLIAKRPNALGEKGTYTILLNQNLEKQYYTPSLEFFIIKNIKAKTNSSSVDIELHILQGMLVGFYLPTNLDEVILETIDTEKCFEKKFIEKDREKTKGLIKNLINNKCYEKLDIGSSFKIELPEGFFYTIKDLDNGNYIALNETGEVYLLEYNPYLIKKIHNNIEEYCLTL